MTDETTAGEAIEREAISDIGKRLMRVGDMNLPLEAQLMLGEIFADVEALAKSAKPQVAYTERPQGDAGDAIDFACGHCAPDEAVAFLDDWRMDRANEWPGYMKWLAAQHRGAAKSAKPRWMRVKPSP